MFNQFKYKFMCMWSLYVTAFINHIKLPSKKQEHFIRYRNQHDHLQNKSKDISYADETNVITCLELPLWDWREKSHTYLDHIIYCFSSLNILSLILITLYVIYQWLKMINAHDTSSLNLMMSSNLPSTPMKMTSKLLVKTVKVSSVDWFSYIEKAEHFVNEVKQVVYQHLTQNELQMNKLRAKPQRFQEIVNVRYAQLFTIQVQLLKQLQHAISLINTNTFITLSVKLSAQWNTQTHLCMTKTEQNWNSFSLSYKPD